MRDFAAPRDERFAALPFPLRHAGSLVSLQPRDILCGGMGVFGGGCHQNQPRIADPRADFAVVQLGELPVLAARSTPCIACEEDTGRSTLALHFAGDGCRYRHGAGRQLIRPGQIHLNPRDGNAVQVGYISGLFCQIEHARLARTLRVIGGGAAGVDLQASWLLGAPTPAGQLGSAEPLFAFVRFLDGLLGDSPELVAGLGLEEQLHRLLAFALLQTAGCSERVRRRFAQAGPRYWSPALDELVDYIHANALSHLTLTDLQEHSRYSARHLQTLFRERFDSTPMQFVRRQRLELAMQRLQGAGPGDSVTRIARICGYRHLAHFSRDFQGAFGVPPSQLLRTAGQRSLMGHHVS